MSSVRRRSERRLTALERRFPDANASLPTRRQVLRDRIDRGNATLKDFEELYGHEIPYIRAMLITRSVYFALVRFHGWEPWAWNPPDAAASIISLPPGAEVPDHLIEPTSWMVDLKLRRPTGKSRVARLAANPRLHTLWFQGNLNRLALGAPDGMPLRTQMANGEWAGAIEYTMQHPQLAEWGEVNTPTCRPWYRLPDDYQPGLPFDMTEDEARELPPPWKEREWWPPPKMTLEQRLELAEQHDLLLRIDA